MQFYFHLVGPDRMILDHVGVDVVDIDEAEQWAVEVIAEQVADTSVSNELEGWVLRACDASGQVFFDLPIGRRSTIIRRRSAEEQPLEEGSDVGANRISILSLRQRRGG